MYTILLYSITLAGLLVSYIKNKQKTKKALKKAYSSLRNILPQFMAVILLIGLLLTLLSPETISKLLGGNTGFIGIMISSVVGSITILPGFIAFPLIAALAGNGAGVAQMAAFASSLMMVGMATAPLESKIF